MSKSKKIIIYSLLSITLLLFLVFIFTRSNHVENIQYQTETSIQEDVSEEKIPEKKSSAPEVKKEIGIQITLEIGEEKYESGVTEEISVYDFMNQIKNEGEITFKEKTYGGIGKFIEEINGLKSDGDNYWIYYVNGVEASIGVSDYKINPGDVVSWKYEKDKY